MAWNDRPMLSFESDVDRVADLRLRGAGGTVLVRVRWPRSARDQDLPPVAVFFPDAGAATRVPEQDDRLCRELCSDAGMVVLCVPWITQQAGPPCSPLERAALALEWSADHADELGADPAQLVVAGRGAGAGAAAALAHRAEDRGWPHIARQLLFR